ncbi:MAG: hypothetical protein ACXWA3_19385 [Acidimicrobiales bacterium]
MSIWKHRSSGRDSVSPLEQQVDDDLAASQADADALIVATLADATTHAERARTRADKVVIGFSLGAQLDTLVSDLADFERGGDDRADLVAARQLDARARHLANEALAQQKQNGIRAVTGAAGIYLGNQQQRR